MPGNSTKGNLGMSRCKVVCSLDGKEPERWLYGAYEDPKKRTFPDKAYAEPVVAYLAKRAGRMLWNSVLPHYKIVPADE